MSDGKVYTAAVLMIGNELLSGRTQDKNLQFLATNLNEMGIRLRECRVIPDVRETIVATVNEMRARHDYVFTTGGIGPTHDDITSECVAEAFGVPMRRYPEAVAALEARLKPGQLNEARLRMATFPDGSTLIENAVSAAPGFQMGNVFVMAGIPSVMQAMFQALKPVLVGGEPMQSRAVRVQLPEGSIAEALRTLQSAYADIDIGSYPAVRQGQFAVTVVMRGTDGARLDELKARLIETLRAMGGEPEDETEADRAGANA